MGLRIDLACALPTGRLGGTLSQDVPSCGTYDTQNWRNDNVKQCGLCYHTGNIPDFAALVPVPDDLSVTCMVVPPLDIW